VAPAKELLLAAVGSGGRKMELRPVQHNKAPEDDPAA
jgi:hypothetical protein